MDHWLTLDVAEQALCAIPYEAHARRFAVGAALKSYFGDDAFAFWDRWSEASINYNQNESRVMWRSFKKTGISIGTFIQLAKECGFVFPREDLTPEEIKQRRAEMAQKQKEAEKRERMEKRKAAEKTRRAALRATRMWLTKLSVTGSSDYLQRKQVDDYGVKYTPKGAIAIPVQDIGGGIHGIQFIKPDGEKRFWPAGMAKSGHFYLLSEVEKETQPIIIGEGYASVATLCKTDVKAAFVVAFDANNLLHVAKAIRKRYPKNPIYIAADDDYQTVGNPGLAKAEEAARLVAGTVLKPIFSQRVDQGWTDFNDLAVFESLDYVRQQIHGVFNPVRENENSAPNVAAMPWRMRLATNKDGTAFIANINNVRLVLEHDQAWRCVLAFNEFATMIVKLKKPPFEHSAECGEWTDDDTEFLRCWLAEHYGFTPKSQDVDAAVSLVAKKNNFHPVRQYLEALKWDGKKRLDLWLSDYLDAGFDHAHEDDDQNEVAKANEYRLKYLDLAGTKWLVGAVARVMQVPCKNDTVLILEGDQGRGKSTALGVLAGDEWFNDTHFEIGSKDGYQVMRGVWIMELAELDAFNKAETTRAKAFFSSKVDTYRPTYAKRSVKVPRQCAFSGSTNQNQYLKDVTGNRRYWPVKCGRINFKKLKEDRDQLWAEALHLYRQGVIWWVAENELKYFEAEQEGRFAEDAWESKIIEWIDDVERRLTKTFTSGEILKGALGMEPHQWKPPEQTRVGLIMHRLGWLKRQKRENNTRLWVYMRPERREVSQP